MIFIEEVKLEAYYWKWIQIDCPVYLNPCVKGLLKCNGLFDVCDINEMGILTIMEKYEAYNWNHRTSRVCIVFDCILGMY